MSQFLIQTSHTPDLFNQRPEAIRADLHSYMAGTFKRQESPALISCIVSFIQKCSIGGIVERLKKSSSKWMKENTGNHSLFWQTGYGAFSVSSSKIDTLTRYIARQEDHHQHLSLSQAYSVD